MKKRIVLAGGSGFLGQVLAGHFVARGYEVIVLTRRPERAARTGISQVEWKGWDGGAWEACLDGAAGAINLAGRSVNCPHTPAHRREIVDSRVDSVRAIGRAIRRAKRPPAVWIQAGSLALHGDAGDRICDEGAPVAHCFAARVCQAWEAAWTAETVPVTRKVLFRIGFVLGERGGALATLENLTRCYLGGQAGNGRQWISWIHVSDFVRMVEWALEREDIAGIYNATGPNPVTNREFMRRLRQALGRPWSPPVPGWAVRLGAWAMRTEGELALTGRRCVPQRLSDLGFRFAWPALGPALEQIYRKS